MEIPIRRPRSRSPLLRCQCSQSLPIFSSFIFLAAILPRSSWAQVENPRSTNSPTPTTLQTSISPSPTLSSSTLTPSKAQSNPPAQSTSSTTTDSQLSDHAFNYYFLIVAAVAIAFCLCILYIGKRRKRKAAIMRSNSERALARDVEGFRGRFGIRRPGYPAINTREQTIEGLNERGEAPPPYVPRSKPPSLRDVDGTIPTPSTDSRVIAGEAVELSSISRLADGPPGYNEHGSESVEGDMGIARPFGAVTIADDEPSLPRPYTALTAPDEQSGLTRPETAVTISGSTRRLLNSSAGSGHGV